MPYPSLIPSSTTATEEVWAAAVYPPVSAKTVGACVMDAMRALPGSAVAVAFHGFATGFTLPMAGCIVTTEASVKAAMLALIPVNGWARAICRPVPGQIGWSFRWEVVDDPGYYGSSGLAAITMPQLSKRSLAAFVDRLLVIGYPAAVVIDQDAVTVTAFTDMDGTLVDAILAIEASGQTVGVRLNDKLGSDQPFEGGAV